MADSGTFNAQELLATAIELENEAAANYLKEMGINRERAVSSARKYPLNPGYQLCYTLGLHRFLDLFHRYGGDNLPYFVRTVLAQGEIHFTYLEKILQEYQ